MMTATACPSTHDLRSFSLGDFADERSDELFEHLRICESCKSELETIEDGEDSLIASLRQGDLDDGFDDEPFCRVAVAKALGALADPGTDLATDDQMYLPDKIGEYEVVRPLGRGGMGQVYLARHTKLGREVALKVLALHRSGDSRMRERFESEMRAIGRLSHPNIVTAHDARDVDGTAVLVTEYIDGFDLGQLVRRAGPLSIPDACEIVRQVAIALQYTHQQNFVHRDVKPSNVMLSRAGEVKLLDLGLARMQESDGQPGPGAEMTATGQALGTADYVAPEQVTNGRDVDGRADIYSLGCTLFKLLTGHAPFSGPAYTTAFAKMTAHVSVDPPSLATMLPETNQGQSTQALCRLVDTMLDKDPAKRPQTPQSVADHLQSFTGGHQLVALVQQASAATADDRTSLLIGTSHTPAAVTQPILSRRVPVAAAIAAGFFGLIIGLVCGVIVRINFPDGTSVVVTGPDDTKVKVTQSPETASDDQVSVGAVPSVAADPALAADDQLKAAGEFDPAAHSPLAFFVLVDAASLDAAEKQAADQALMTSITQSSAGAEAVPVVTEHGIWFPAEQDIRAPVKSTHGQATYVLAMRKPDAQVQWDDFDGHVMSAMSSHPGGKGEPMIELEFDDQLTAKMEAMTANYLRHHMAIVVANRVMSAPVIQSAIGRSARLTGKFKPDEVRFLMASFDGGLVAPLKREAAKPDVSDWSRLQGVWQIDSDSIPDGMSQPFRGYLMVVRAQHVVMVLAGDVTPAIAMTLDESKSPRRYAFANSAQGRSQGTGSYRFLGPTTFEMAPSNPDGTYPKDFFDALDGKRQTSRWNRLGSVPETEQEFSRLMVRCSDDVKKSLAAYFRRQQTPGDASLPDARRDAAGALAAADTRQNLKLMAIAFHNFHATYRKFPGYANELEGSSGVPKGKKTYPFSWRVAILPFIEQNDLFERYRFDEPWDSERNKSLLAEMPAIYRSPFADDDQSSTETNYQGLATKGGLMEEAHGLKLRDCEDGTANTLLLVETKDSVPWTKPQDLTTTDIVPLGDEGLWYALADGSVRQMNPVDQEELEKLITRSGRETIKR